MRSPRAKPSSSRTRVVVVTADPPFADLVRDTFRAAPQIELEVIDGALAAQADAVAAADATVVVIDLNVAGADDMAALEALTARLDGWPPVVTVTDVFDKEVMRQLLKLRIADFLVKPVQPVELVRTCARVVQTPAAGDTSEAEIFTYLSAVGGAGVTTLAIQTALLLLGSGTQKTRPATCLVDLDFQHGACADYLDLEPRLDLGEIEPRPERLDRQLLEVMLSYHASGLAVIAAPCRPAEMRSFDPEIVTRLLDLVSSHFNYVVIDLPRTWFPWTDNVLLGSNRVYVVSELTVPGIKHAKQLVGAIRERLDEGPRPQVLINRFEQSLFGTGLRKRDLDQALGDDLLATIPNDYRLVREAIDRGVPLDEVKPGNRISAQLRKIVTPAQATERAVEPTAKRRLGLSWARG
ncbi:Septum site-determining protein MinD [Rhodoplanes serenus]|uniref:Septum site-determining protein MinD n=1 Tax=Rhodoplanes serenus TaxID=200615 RepID=A0A3S4FG81_9BRAD|nr:response regulator [Rhodoplanes serenus]VCU11458.1 Septum site-determining protein MinD [Rhodoplanes serenus]